MQYIHVAKDKPQDHREQGVELAGINIPVPPTPDFRDTQETDGSSASDAPALLQCVEAPCSKRARIMGLSDAQADAISSALKRCKK